MKFDAVKMLEFKKSFKFEYRFRQNYNQIMSDKIQELLEQAKSSDENDSSIVCARRDFPTEPEAKDFFQKVKGEFFDMQEWSAKSTASDYDRFDENGYLLDKFPLSEGDFIRISIKGLDKYDWVKIVGIYETASQFVITVEPTYDPTEERVDKNVTSHFFTSEARNNFCLQKDKKTVEFYVIGLHEKTNTNETDSLYESARNAATANFGYYLGIQKSVWKDFCNNFLEIKN